MQVKLHVCIRSITGIPNALEERFRPTRLRLKVVERRSSQVREFALIAVSASSIREMFRVTIRELKNKRIPCHIF